jgi:hypothetical protein
LLNVQQAVFQLCSGREQIQEIHYIEEFDDTKEVVRIRKSKNRQYNDQKDKQRSTKHTNKTKDRVTRTPLNTGGELRCFGRVSISCSTNGTRRVNLVTNPEIMRGGLSEPEQLLLIATGKKMTLFLALDFMNLDK